LSKGSDAARRRPKKRRNRMKSDEESDERSDEWFRTRAKELYGRDGEIEIDSNARISYGVDEGAYVEAWVRVPFEEERREQDEGQKTRGTCT
jgi:hypothetical protein